MGLPPSSYQRRRRSGSSVGSSGSASITSSGAVGRPTLRECSGCGTEFDDDREAAIVDQNIERCPACGHDNSTPATAADGSGDAVTLQAPAGSEVETPALRVTLTVDAGNEVGLVADG